MNSSEFRCALHADAHSPIPIRWQLAEQAKHGIEGGGVSHDRPLPRTRERAGFLDINPNTVKRAIEDVDGLDAADTPVPDPARRRC